MKTKSTLILTLFMALIVQLSFAQQNTISGTVSDENGLPLLGATIVISGTTSGTTTDFDGNYKINANTGDVLTFSYVGYQNQNPSAFFSRLIPCAVTTTSSSVLSSCRVTFTVLEFPTLYFNVQPQQTKQKFSKKHSKPPNSGGFLIYNINICL